ncbi:T9SS type A sorting domain-containing protein [Algoriphagus aestuariicola]|uniref:T9SS type A sorting domain-containing protein n=1 Tax=Algoriphagus aestuariicola TaxID=1852016 RepID=A0ABS3BU59_9BACT|nr:T9SS type A sorting domain-containing protein [Algoriphagus aestuariicola]MBN7802595.1 T9SS type A sorting domain-containing protein [Algoriphagus aestuariicola]
MDTNTFLDSRRNFFTRRIYWLFLAVAAVWLLLGKAFSQELNAYKTTASGNFSDISIWVFWDGITWNPATSKPGQGNDIYINQTHTLTLTSNEAVKSVFINAETGAGQKLNLSGFQLHVYGSLNAFSGAAPGTPDNAWNSQNWIGNSVSSTLVFKGSSRVIVQKNSWSAQTTQSRFAVIFDADPGETLTLEAPLKALAFTVRSGTLFQKIDTSVLPNTCFSLSFNTETSVFGVGPYGSMVVESGATFISECNAGILNRSTSGTTSAQDFTLQNGGTLILEGNAPRIEAANFQLDGKIVFRGGSTGKTYLASSYADAATPISVRDIELQGSQNLALPNQLILHGNLEKSGSGNFTASNTSLTLAGSGDQEILGFLLVVRDLTLTKTGGNFFPNSDLTVQRDLTLTQGSMDLEGNNLSINTGLAGTFVYFDGSWKNVGQFHYYGIPATLNGANSTFPFQDTRNGGIRKVQLLGNSAGGNLQISFTEYSGAEYNSGFDDVDGTEILYRLFSYFQFSGITPTPNPLELRISADKLIVDDVDDLRIVGTGYAAPGSHLPGIDPTELWARRSLSFSDLPGKNFTVGSFRTASVLPVHWLETDASLTKQGILLKWKVVGDGSDFFFEIYKSHDPIESGWEKLGEIASQANSHVLEHFQFLDESADLRRDNFYRIKQLDKTANFTWSNVLRVGRQIEAEANSLSIYPNPYSNGPLHLVLPPNLDLRRSQLLIQNSQGQLVAQSKYLGADIQPLIQTLPPGIYFVWIISEQHQLVVKLIRK